VSWLRKVSLLSKILLPLDVVVAAAVVVCVQYPVFRLKTVEVTGGDGRPASPEVYDQVCRAVKIAPDSNLLSIEPELVARLLLLDDKVAKVAVRLDPPHNLQVRVTPAKPIIWWAGREVTSLAADGNPVPRSATADLPIGIGRAAGDQAYARWQLVEVYQRLVSHNRRWAEVISQIGWDSAMGWQLVLNGKGERILLGRQVSTERLDRVAGFLESIPENQWNDATIDARFDKRIVLIPQVEVPVHGADSGGTGLMPVRAVHRDTAHTPSGGRS
jgi:cell division septal protein FtsQ